MFHSAPEGHDHISRVHNVALREGIGESLRGILDPDLTDMPPHLLLLMKRFQRAG